MPCQCAEALLLKPDAQLRRWDRAQDVMRRIGTQLLEEKKAAIMREAADGKEKARSRDLLTLLLKSNMATDIPENQRLSDEDVIARTWLPSFLSHSGLAADTRHARPPQRSPRTSLAVPSYHIHPYRRPLIRY